MPATTRILLCAGSALLAIAATSAPAAAQARLDAVRVTTPAPSKADRLHAAAEALPTETRFWKKAARLHEESATRRAATDPMSVSCLRTAAFLRFYAGEPRTAVELMEQAATRASEMGDVVTAANSYVDAAFIAQGLHQADRTAALRERAERLSHSPLLEEAQRESIRTRLAQWVEVQTADRR